MENITPTLVLLWDIKRSLEAGYSVASGLKFFIDRDEDHEFSRIVRKWYIELQSEPITAPEPSLTPTRRHLLALIGLGLKGQSILEPLRSYELELLISCDEEIQRHVAKLPLLLLLPLMGLIFPALMVLLLGPLLKMIQL